MNYWLQEQRIISTLSHLPALLERRNRQQNGFKLLGGRGGGF